MYNTNYKVTGYMVNGSGNIILIATLNTYDEAFRVLCSVVSSGEWTDLQIKAVQDEK